MPENREDLIRLLVIGNVVITVLLLIWAVTVVANPQLWFPGAYAEKGERGDQGPAGDKGPVGKRGPVGPAGPNVDRALTAAEDLDYRVADLEDQISNVQSNVNNVRNIADNADVTADDTCTSLSDLMDTLRQEDFITGGYLYCPGTW